MKIDLTCPIELSSISFNEETQTAQLEFYNLSNQAVTSMKYTLISSDADNENIKETPAELEGITFAQQDTFKTVVATEKAENYEVIFTEITFSDGTVYTFQGEMTEISFEKAEGTELSRIKRAGAEDGVCYSKEEKDYWLCVCSKANLPASESCIRCARAKDDVLKDFATEESVALAILNKEDNEEKIIAEEKVANKDKMMKLLKKGGIIAAIIAAVLIIAFFAFKLVVTSIGDSSAKAGDYKKAYSMYKLAGSNKTDKIANRVYGNSSTNLNALDLIAQNDTSVYFSNIEHIYKQDKATGKHEILKKVSAHSLNISGDWLYYINLNDNNKIYKMSFDGKTNEAVCDTPAYGIFTVFNDIYFIAEPIINEDDEKDEEKIKAQAPVYVLKEGAKEPTLVLDADASVFSIYNDKIYYTDSADGEKLKCMKLSGGEAQTIIDTSVYEFAIANGKIYYTDSNEKDETPHSLEVADLKGKHIETLVDTAVVTTFNISGDTIYYSDYNNQGTLFKKEKGKDAVPFAEEVAVASMSGDAIFYYSYENTFHISKTDKSGFDLVEMPQIEPAPSETSETSEPTEETEETPAD